jgi:DNA-directed RNA polymerase subunit RPC12/RpoP
MNCDRCGKAFKLGEQRLQADNGVYCGTCYNRIRAMGRCRP